MSSYSASRIGWWKKGVAVASGVLAALVGIGWAGLQARPAAFPPVAQVPPPEETVPIPSGLPAPAERFYRATYGDRIPVIETAVVTGRGTLRIFGITVPSRFRFTHDAGRDYRHYFELTFFGFPIMHANEYYVDGKERMELPMGIEENNPKLDQGGNLGMWAEIMKWFPAALLTDERVRWEPVDDVTALLVVPFEDVEERFVVRFDPVTGGMLHLESMRYRNGVGEKVLWIDGAWFDEGRPWAVFDAEEIVHNVEVNVSVDAKGL